MTANAPRPVKGKRVETFWQAETFDANKRHYLGLGLCYTCAAQAAWGHQLGFSQIHEPCHACQPIVDRFPLAKQGKWRSNSPRSGAKLSTGLRPPTSQ